MAEYEFGRFVISKAGHDKSNIYIIMKEDQEYVYLVDGIIKTLDNPKRKNKKHVKGIHYLDDNLIMKYNSNKLITNEDIKRAIKIYQTQGEV